MTCYYAKPDQAYSEHVEEAYRAWLEVIAAKEQLIERMSKKHGFSKERFLKSSLLTVVIHDLGKMSSPFQTMMEARRTGKKFNIRNNYRHELVSFVFAVAAAGILTKTEGFLNQLPVEALAVAGHHRPLNSDLTSFDRESRAQTPSFVTGGLKKAIDISNEIFARHGWQFPVLDSKLEKKRPYSLLGSLVEPGNNIIGKLLERDGEERARDLYILLKGLLHYADWYGSGKARVNYFVNVSPDQLIESLARRCQEKKIAFQGLRSFQSKMGNCSGHLLAMAPTGSGKTEGSLLWALKNAREMGGAKIIYLLPTMNTANQIWQRLSETFGKENVGLTHSTANLFLMGESEESEGDSWEDRRDLLFHQSFMRPVTVGTVDQWLTCGFNAGRWVLKEINAANAVIILDEVHTYDGWTLGLIIANIRHFAARGSRFLLMSATMPQTIIDLFQTVICDLNVIKDEDLLNARRSVYQVVEATIEKADEAIFEAITAGRKVLVVVNTVKKCQQLAKHFSILNPLCYHSRFILKDRKKIEEKIDESHFVIATQVLEVSLDIDYDWLFTECAPPDAIAQRAGRVNRYRNPDRDSKVIIYQPSSESGKIYNPLNASEDLLKSSYKAFQTSQGRLCEKDLIDIVEKVYANYRVDDTEPFREAVDVYRQTQKKRMAVFDSRLGEEEQEVTRQSKYDTVSVIPYCFYEEVIDLPPRERKWYELKVPLWYFLKYKKVYSGLFFCDLEYDGSIGALLKPAENKVTSW